MPSVIFTGPVMPPTPPIPPPPDVKEVEGWNKFFSTERNYLTTLKRKDRNDLITIANKQRTGDVPLRIQVLRSNLPLGVKTRIFDDMGSCCEPKYERWVKHALRLPLGKPYKSSFAMDTLVQRVQRASDAMDLKVTGNVGAKREILKLVCQQHVEGKDVRPSYSLAFEGPPGTGKTHFVREALKPALDRPLISIPLGGATDVSYLLGTIYTYEGSKPGRLVDALVEAGCSDPIIHFDEVDKISTTERGMEIASTLIHLIDPSSNSEIRDRYLHSIDIDFRKCTFVFSFNDASNVHPILLDRMKRISIPAPSVEDKVDIVVKHIVPRVQARLSTTMTLSPEAVGWIVGRSACGLRGVEKEVDHVLGEAHMNVTCHQILGEDATSLTDLLDSEGRVRVTFAEKVLLDLEGPKEAQCPAPCMMYT
jgi:ATP-dependent Lon protease